MRRAGGVINLNYFKLSLLFVHESSQALAELLGEFVLFLWLKDEVGQLQYLISAASVKHCFKCTKKLSQSSFRSILYLQLVFP